MANSPANPQARPVAVKTAATLLVRLPASTEAPANRDDLTARWMQLAQSDALEPRTRADALSAFFESAVANDAAWARSWALKTPLAAARAGAFLRLSRAAGTKSS